MTDSAMMPALFDFEDVDNGAGLVGAEADARVPEAKEDVKVVGLTRTR